MMYVSDDLMWSYYELLTDLTSVEIKKLKSAYLRNDVSAHEIKSELSKKIIKDFHSAEQAEEAARNYQDSVKSKVVVGEVAMKKVRARNTSAAVSNLLVESGLVKSIKEISKNPQAKIVYDGQSIDALNSKEYFVEIKAGETRRLQYGNKKAYDLVGVGVQIEHRECFSDLLQSYGYSEELELLEVKFKDSGKTYEYYNVPRRTLEELEAIVCSEEKIGNFFNKNIRNNFSSIEIKA
jgi:hypothetical protein